MCTIEIDIKGEWLATQVLLQLIEQAVHAGISTFGLLDQSSVKDYPAVITGTQRPHPQVISQCAIVFACAKYRKDIVKIMRII